MKNMLKKTGVALAVLCVIVLYGCASQAVNKLAIPASGELKFQGQGWMVWGNGLKAAASVNTVNLNGNVREAGYLSTHLDTALKNKTVVLEIENADSSVFNEDRMLKITVNHNDRLIHPVNVRVLMYGEYVPPFYDRIEFILPGDFDGKMNFVFFYADLKDLKITAYYK